MGLRDCDTILTKVDCDWRDVKNECRNTENKAPTTNEATVLFRRKILMAEHSPIRLLRVRWRWPSIKSWVMGHYVRHHEGIEKWVGTRRSDRTGVDRGTLTQNELVPLDMEANAQGLINMAKVRLCSCAASETRAYMEDLKRRIHDVEPELGDAMVPSCVYRGGCGEFADCGFWRRFCARHPDVDMGDLFARYDTYNHEFQERVTRTEA